MTITVRFEAWYVIPRNTCLSWHVRATVARCPPGSSPSNAWNHFISVNGDTKQFWKKKGYVAKKVNCEFTHEINSGSQDHEAR